MKVEYIAEADAPPPPSATSKAAQVILDGLRALPEGKVLRATPAEGHIVRRLKSSFTRVAKSNNLAIEIYEARDQPGVIFVRKRRGK